ncbi:diguanylate cyclase [Paenibacillus sp. M1]|uniref:Diguanylate cyclase n=1 Tax=Paenibacillus haidiansis TaxID=1574488 RepID=A0ABU7VSS0_9BACL
MNANGTLDSLTNIWDRKTMLAKLSAIHASGKRFGVLLCDVDFFINIDSKVGSVEGDLILQRIASFFKKIEFFTVGRYGGDEFILIAEGVDQKQIVQMAEHLRKNFRKQRFVSGDSIYAKVPITVSIGAVIGGLTKTTESLLKKAEIALAMAKKQGRNRTVLSDDKDIVLYYDHTANVSTIVGGQLKGYAGDGGPSVQACIAEPYGVELMNNGELLIVDRGNHCIRQIDSRGVISSFAGKGRYGYSGDNEDAVNALMNKPSGVAASADGNVFIADTGNHCIRKINRNGNIYTIAGCGMEGYEGDGGLAINAKLSRPGGVAVDGKGNVYTNDYGNNVIRKISIDGIISTVAGSGKFGYEGDGGSPLVASLDRPYGLAVTPNGHKLYIADYGNHCIRVVDMENNSIRTVCGKGIPGYAGDGGPGEAALLNGPFWVSIWNEDFILIADSENHCIRLYDVVSDRITTIVGNAKSGYHDSMLDKSEASFNLPAGLVADNNGGGCLYVADYGNNAVRRVLFNSSSSGGRQ